MSLCVGWGVGGRGKTVVPGRPANTTIQQFLSYHLLHNWRLFSARQKKEIDFVAVSLFTMNNTSIVLHTSWVRNSGRALLSGSVPLGWTELTQHSGGRMEGCTQLCPSPSSWQLRAPWNGVGWHGSCRSCSRPATQLGQSFRNQYRLEGRRKGPHLGVSFLTLKFSKSCCVSSIVISHSE